MTSDLMKCSESPVEYGDAQYRHAFGRVASLDLTAGPSTGAIPCNLGKELH